MDEDWEALPLVLSGPMVRRADRGGVAVWIALRDARDVTLEVWDATAEAERVAAGRCETVALGRRLHVAVVVAEGALQWGHLYTYNLSFQALPTREAAPRGDLFAPGILVAESAPERAAAAARSRLTYCDENAVAPALPSFALPPEDLNHVRLVHGSCRVPHAQGRDALPALDVMLAHAAKDPEARPQQLFLTGDQIYANNIAPEILPALTQTGDQLLGWTELLPGVEKTPKDYPPLTREEVVRTHAGLLEWGDSSHLLGLGEIYALYLLNFSEVLWPESWEPSARGKRMRAHLAGLPAVRRALANVATFMIFDDHEVTDDWALTLEWCQSVLSRPLGRRLLMNALAGYAVFQGWGNSPAQFAEPAEGETAPPGRRLLASLVEWRGTGAAEKEISALLGIPPDAEDVLQHSPPQLSPPVGAIDWFYRWRGPGYEVLVVDGRTWRAYPGESNVDRPDILSENAMRTQLVEPGPTDAPLTVLVSSSAILPFPKPWYARAAIWCASNWHAFKRGLGRKYAQVYDRDRGEAWQGQSPCFERLLATLATRPTARGGQRRLRALVLAGDIHVGLAARLEYRAERPWCEPVAEPSPARMVWAYFTSSPMHNENGGTRLAHRLGYGLLSGPPRRDWAGWRQAPEIEMLRPPWLAGRWRAPRPSGEPALLDMRRPDALQPSAPPDWTYRVEFVDGNPEDRDQPNADAAAAPNGLPYPEELAAAAATHRARVRRSGRGRSIVGRNHLGEIRLQWTDAHRSATQILWWRPTETAPLLPLTSYQVSLDFDDEAV